MAAKQLERDGRAPRQADHVSRSQANRFDDPGEARCIVGECEAFGGKIVRLADSWLIPSDHGELVLKRFELGRPSATVLHRAVDEHDRWPAPGPPVGDIESVDPHVFHGLHLAGR